MKKISSKLLLFGAILIVGLGVFGNIDSYAEEEDSDGAEDVFSGTSISLTPVSKILQISSDSVYNDVFTVKNDGNDEIKIEVYAAPYSYVYSDEEDLYKLGFSNENNFTQISRWITFEDVDGKYVEKAYYTVKAEESLDVKYQITTPSNIPSGGQYAVIFAHTLSNATSASGVRTEASPGIVIYGRSTEGEVDTSAEISNLKISKNVSEDGTTRNNIYATAKIKNVGNVDFNATGVMKVEPIIGGGEYETPNTKGRLSIIPESELVSSDEWEETPSFGIYKVTWTVMVGDQTESTTRVIFLFSPIAVVISIILLTIVIIWIIIRVRKRKERHSRLAV